MRHKHVRCKLNHYTPPKPLPPLSLLPQANYTLKPRAQGSSAISPNEYPTTPHRRRPLPAIPPKLHTYTEEAHHTSPLQHEALPYHRQLTQAFRLYHHLVGVPPPYRYEAYSAITTPQRKHLAAAAFRAYRAHWLFGRRHSDEGIAFSFVRGTC